MAISLQDLKGGLDPTGLVTLNASQIFQITDTGTIGDDRGLIVESTDSALDTPIVPAGGVTARFTRYLWKRRLFADADTPKLYLWDNSAVSHATFLKWVEVTADISELTALIDQAIDDSAEALTKANLAITQSGTAITVANDALTVANETSDRVDVVEDAIDPLAISKIAPSTTALQILRTKADLSAVEWVDAILTQLEAIGAAFQIPRVKSDLTGIEWTTAPLTKLSALGTALQILRTNAAADAAEWVAPSLVSVTESYVEVDSVTLAVSLTTVREFVHGLGVVPSLVKVTLVCDVADATVQLVLFAGPIGFVGDEIPIESVRDPAGITDNPCCVVFDATHILVYIENATLTLVSLNPTILTNTSWKIKVRAYV